MPYTPILATLGYVFSPDGRRVLMIHRNGRPDDLHLGKYNGLGGKLDPGEDVVAGSAPRGPRGGRDRVRRAATRRHDLLAGVRQARARTGSGSSSGSLRFTGTPLAANPEGKLEWVEVERVSSLPLWDGDRFFLPLVFDRKGPQFHGVMPYRDGKPLSLVGHSDPAD